MSTHPEPGQNPASNPAEAVSEEPMPPYGEASAPPPAHRPAPGHPADPGLSLPTPERAVGGVVAPDPRPRRARRSLRTSPAPAHVGPLLDLLGDDSPSTLRAVRRELLALGRRAHPALRRAARGSDPLRRGRARDLLLFAERQKAARHLARGVSRGAPELEAGLQRIERFLDPSLDTRPYRKALDAMGREVARRAAAAPESLERPLVLVDYLAGELSFSGFDPGQDPVPRLAHLQVHRLLETKEGLPLTVCALYVLVGRRAGIEVDILPLPGRTMVQLVHGDDRVLIDAFDGGRPRTEADLVDFLAHHGLPYRSAWFQPAPDAVLLQRQIVNTVRCLRSRGLAREARLLRAPLGALSRERVRRQRKPEST